MPRTLEAFRISASIRQYRKERSLSQKQLAKLCRVDQSQISRFESGRFLRASTNPRAPGDPERTVTRTARS